MRHSVPLVPIALGFPGPLVGLYILVYIIKETHLLVCLSRLISESLCILLSLAIRGVRRCEFYYLKPYATNSAIHSSLYLASLL